MIIQRYIVKEIALSFFATLIVLLLIILGNTFVRLLGDVSSGSLPVDVLGKLVFFKSINGVIKLVPIALLIGMMLAFGRLYRDHEVSAMHSAGLGPKGFYKGIFLFVGPLTAVVALLVILVVPQLEKASNDIKNEVKQRPEAAGIPVGEFMHANAGDKRVTLFVEDIDQDNVVMKRFFLHLEDKENDKGNNKEKDKGKSEEGAAQETKIQTEEKQSTTDVVDEPIDNTDVVLSAQKALLYIDSENGDRVFKIENGSRYDHNRSTGEFSIFKFAEHGIHIPALKIKISKDLESKTISELLDIGDNESHAEVHWRIALILSAPIMALLAFPLSYTTPRQGKFGKLAIGILLYAVYANLVITGQSMIEEGKIPNWLGLWWAHLIFIVLALWLVHRQYGRVR